MLLALSGVTGIGKSYFKEKLVEEDLLELVKKMVLMEFL